MAFIVREYFSGGGCRVVTQFKEAHDAETYITHLATAWCENIDDFTLADILRLIVEAVGGDWSRLPGITKNTLATDLRAEGISVGLLAALSGDPEATEDSVEESIQLKFEDYFYFWGIVDEADDLPQNVSPLYAGPNVLMNDGKVQLTVHYG